MLALGAFVVKSIGGSKDVDSVELDNPPNDLAVDTDAFLIARAKDADGNVIPFHVRIVALPQSQAQHEFIERIIDLQQFATELAKFLAAMYRIDPTGGPPPGQHNFFRGGPLTIYDTETRDAIASLHGKIDTDAVSSVWETALQATWHGTLAKGTRKAPRQIQWKIAPTGSASDGTWRGEVGTTVRFLKTTNDGSVQITSEVDNDHGVVSRFSPAEPQLLSGMKPGAS